jgi:hypothetical protein
MTIKPIVEGFLTAILASWIAAVFVLAVLGMAYQGGAL